MYIIIVRNRNAKASLATRQHEWTFHGFLSKAHETYQKEHPHRHNKSENNNIRIRIMKWYLKYSIIIIAAVAVIVIVDNEAAPLHRCSCMKRKRRLDRLFCSMALFWYARHMSNLRNLSFCERTVRQRKIYKNKNKCYAIRCNRSLQLQKKKSDDDGASTYFLLHVRSPALSYNKKSFANRNGRRKKKRIYSL